MGPIILTCPKCGSQLRAPAGFSGKQYRCAKCGSINPVDSSSGAAPKADPPPAAGVAARAPTPGLQAPAASATPTTGTAAPSVSATPAPSLSRPPARKRPASADLVEFEKAIGAADKSALRPLRWAFLLTLVPLVWHTFVGGKVQVDPSEAKAAFEQKLEERLASQPSLRESLAKLGEGSGPIEKLSIWTQAFGDNEYSDAINQLRRESGELGEDQTAYVAALLESAFMQAHCGLLPPPFLPEGTWAHWGLGALAAAAFLLYFCFAYPRGNAHPAQLFGIGLLTGTVGVIFLIAMQWISAVATQVRIRGGGIVVLIWLILVAIAFSYSAADDPDNGFILSCLGFTFGVGLMEELTKLLPVVWHYRSDGTLSWRGACVWGLASGAGFGVSEGIIYSFRYYNGSDTVGIYVVRFVSCVALHAAWAGAAAIHTYRRRDYFKGEMDKGDWVRAVFPALAIPMVLHGLYDTLLKMDMVTWSLVVGAVSFMFFVFLQEREARSQAALAMEMMGIRC